LRRIHQLPDVADALRLSALRIRTYQNFCVSPLVGQVPCSWPLLSLTLLVNLLINLLFLFH
jgi:hypothetical protein